MSHGSIGNRTTGGSRLPNDGGDPGALPGQEVFRFYLQLLAGGTGTGGRPRAPSPLSQSSQGHAAGTAGLFLLPGPGHFGRLERPRPQKAGGVGTGDRQSG